MRACDKCGRQSEHVHQSDYAEAWLCYLCYSALPQARSVAQAKRLLPDPPKYKPTAYEVFVHKVWDRLETRTGRPVFSLGADTAAAYCPACRRGTLTLTFVDTHPPRARVRSRAQSGHCSEGCTLPEIWGALS